MNDAGVTEIGPARMPHIAFVRSAFLVRLMERLEIASKVILLVATALFLSPMLGAALGMFAAVAFVGGRRLSRALRTTEAALVVEGDSLLVAVGAHHVRRVEGESFVVAADAREVRRIPLSASEPVASRPTAAARERAWSCAVGPAWSSTRISRPVKGALSSVTSGCRRASDR